MVPCDILLDRCLKTIRIMASTSFLSISFEAVNACKLIKLDTGSRSECSILSYVWKAPREIALRMGIFTVVFFGALSLITQRAIPSAFYYTVSFSCGAFLVLMGVYPLLELFIVWGIPLL